MNDVFPQQAKFRRKIENTLLQFFEGEGYELVSSGAFEYLDTLLRGRLPGIAEDWVQVFDVTGRTMALRPDMTPSIARMAAPLLAAGRTEIQWSYAERVYRRCADPAFLSWASGKAAESTQVGVEWIGTPGMTSDADVLVLCQKSLTELDIVDWQMVISHADFAPAFFAALGLSGGAIGRLLACLSEGDYVGFRTEFAAADWRQQQQSGAVNDNDGAGDAGDILTLLGSINPCVPATFPYHLLDDWEATTAGRSTLEAWQSLVSLAENLRALGNPEGMSFDLTLRRDVTYYTGIVFEVFAPGVGAPIAAGGRYDNLLQHFGQSAAAVGFMYEVERLLAVLTDGAWLHGHAQTGTNAIAMEGSVS